MIMRRSKAVHPRYTVIIQWDEQDQIYIASLPEWGPYCKTHGATYEEAAKNAEEVLALLMKDGKGKPAALPPEKLFRYPGADVINLPDEERAMPRAKPSRKKARQSV
jgi:antitoxin HicB